MLISFKISNFLSFDTEQTISMIPSISKELKEHIIKLDKIKLLKMAIIFGANSSGKSNLIKAITLGKELVTGNIGTRYKNYFSKVSLENKNKDTVLEYTFYVDGFFYSYGFSLILNEGTITGEWLYEINPETDQENLIFERSPKENYFQCSIKLSEEKKARFETYKYDLRSNTQTLFVNEMNRNKNTDSSFAVFKRINDWFEHSLNINYQNQEITKLDYVFTDKNDKFLELLKLYDTGIVDFVKTKVELEDLKGKVTTKIFDTINEEINVNIAKKKEIAFGIRLQNALYNIFCHENNSWEIYSISLKHNNSDFTFEFEEESDGTKRLFDLFDIIINPKEDAIYMIDEINRSIHPLLTYKYIESFNEYLYDHHVQILFTTHESSILTQDLIRRDEIWFMEKTENNSSKLYSLDIFKDKFDKEISKSYLQGNYGAVPIITKKEAK